MNNMEEYYMCIFLTHGDWHIKDSEHCAKQNESPPEKNRAKPDCGRICSCANDTDRGFA